MDYLRPAILNELEGARNILIAGAGGGFDVFSGLPLYFGLRAAGRNVPLANLSFTQLEGVPGRWLTPALLEVTPNTTNGPAYFPEFFLTQWFREQGESISIYGFDRVGVQPLLAGYRALVQELAIDAVVLVDGGTDSLMRGDETGLGTPEEDMCSIAAVDELDVPRKFLMCLGFGVDSFTAFAMRTFWKRSLN